MSPCRELCFLSKLSGCCNRSCNVKRTKHQRKGFLFFSILSLIFILSSIWMDWSLAKLLRRNKKFKRTCWKMGEMWMATRRSLPKLPFTARQKRLVFLLALFRLLRRLLKPPPPPPLTINKHIFLGLKIRSRRLCRGRLLRLLAFWFASRDWTRRKRTAKNKWLIFSKQKIRTATSENDGDVRFISRAVTASLTAVVGVVGRLILENYFFFSTVGSMSLSLDL